MWFPNLPGSLADRQYQTSALKTRIDYETVECPRVPTFGSVANRSLFQEECVVGDRSPQLAAERARIEDRRSALDEGQCARYPARTSRGWQSPPLSHWDRL